MRSQSRDGRNKPGKQRGDGHQMGSAGEGKALTFGEHGCGSGQRATSSSGSDGGEKHNAVG